MQGEQGRILHFGETNITEEGKPAKVPGNGGALILECLPLRALVRKIQLNWGQIRRP